MSKNDELEEKKELLMNNVDFEIFRFMIWGKFWSLWGRKVWKKLSTFMKRIVD